MEAEEPTSDGTFSMRRRTYVVFFVDSGGDDIVGV